MPLTPQRYSLPALRGRAPAAALGLWACLGLAASAAQASAPVAEGVATLVIGKAQRQAADGVTEPVTRGIVIREGDTIETQAGGHVHVRFSDGGRVSVRPSSRLRVENYRHDAQQPQLSAIRFKLEEGAVRSITGTWGEAQRERFRLNTPIAAIGVKGTDFVVRSSGDATAASVFSGAIVLAPMAEQCISSLGPCMTGNEKLLSQEMRGQMLELQRRAPVPQLVPAVDLLAASAAPRIAAAPMVDAHSPAPDAFKAAAVSSDAARPTSAVAAAAMAEVRPSDALSPSTSSLKLDPIASVIAPAPVPPPRVEQLTWIRYDWAPPMEGDDFTRRFDAALRAGSETVATNGALSMWRTASVPVSLPTQGRVDFRLAKSAAVVSRGDGRSFEAVQVSNARLRIDFDDATFDTGLTASGAQLGSVLVQGWGQITSDGRFKQMDGTANISGGLNADGKEAGYVFTKPVGPGTVLQGVTLWGR